MKEYQQLQVQLVLEVVRQEKFRLRPPFYCAVTPTKQSDVILLRNIIHVLFM